MARYDERVYVAISTEMLERLRELAELFGFEWDGQPNIARALRCAARTGLQVLLAEAEERDDGER